MSPFWYYDDTAYTFVSWFNGENVNEHIKRYEICGKELYANGNRAKYGVMIIRTENRQRNNRIVFYLDESETELIKEKTALAGLRNREAYIRKMVLDGYAVRLDLGVVQKTVQLLSNSSSNLNQIAKRANETRSLVREPDISNSEFDFWEKLRKRSVLKAFDGGDKQD